MRQDPEVEFTPLLKEPFVLACPRGHLRAVHGLDIEFHERIVTACGNRNAPPDLLHNAEISALSITPGSNRLADVLATNARSSPCCKHPRCAPTSPQGKVADIEREVSELKARGVVFENYDMPGEKSASGVVTAGGAKAAWFKDSEGNIMALIESA